MTNFKKIVLGLVVVLCAHYLLVAAMTTSRRKH